ncbi:hypothetical protein A6D98_09920 [Aliivibrio fischeri]|uniref:hypothetical protein n=1 Tax=Aliivibrio fischeri TaxID=668 RepID=UPI00080EA335|nr:hypothetical protein [Aliivibrio fischeri]OCH60907.1 hypothetical protein A6D98_09920 [Aliivibrio fischeri]
MNKKNRLSKNQKDALFILALLESKNKTNPVAVTKVRSMVESIRAGVLDPSNFRKGVHMLASRGLIEVGRYKDLSLAMKLTSLGRHDAAKIYRERTGEQLDIKNTEDEQITIFDNKEGLHHDI